MQTELLKLITINPEVCHGKPTLRNMRYTVSMILDLLSAGMTTEELIADYPALKKEDIQACLLYASCLSETKTIHKLSA
jgi:uncharacterized protein (DUF433 family)